MAELRLKGIFDPTPVINQGGITFVPYGCDCTKTNEFEVSPIGHEAFCMPQYDEQIIPYQNIDNACDRVEIQEIETPPPFCWEDNSCFDKCDRLEVILDKCKRIDLCTV
jgi:hypothetical protein